MERRERVILTIHAVTAVLAIAALVVSLASNAHQTAENSKKLDLTQTQTEINKSQILGLKVSRVESRFQICTLLRQIILKSSPPSKQAQARKFLATYGLTNCETYANATS